MERETMIRLAALAMAMAFVACEPVSATERKLHAKEICELDRQNRARDLPISDTEAYGCDICPDQCRWVDLHPLPPKVLLRSYRRAAKEYGEDRTYGDAWSEVERLACIVKGSGKPVQEAFLRFLDDKDVGVRYCAAVHAIDHGLATDKPLQVLRAVAEGQSELALDARIRLQDWDAGIPVEL